MIQYATQRLIDSLWTMAFIINDDQTITIISYDRENTIGYDFEKSLDRLTIEEDNDRTAQAIYLDTYEPFKYCASKENGIKYEVANKRNVFDYKSQFSMA
jgi:hypothetical protein